MLLMSTNDFSHHAVDNWGLPELCTAKTKQNTNTVKEEMKKYSS